MSRSMPLAAIFLAFAGFVSLANARAQQTSNNWSGYVVQGPTDAFGAAPFTTFSTVGAIWTQPAVDCTTQNARVSIWVGLDGWGSPTVEQTGTEAVCGAAVAPLYYKAWWEMYAGSASSGQLVFDVYPGDQIEASVTYTNAGYVMAITDKTLGKSFATTQPCDASVICYRGSAEWIVERPGGGKYPLADYGTAGFTNLAEQFSGPNPTAIGISMVDKSTDVTLSTCTLSEVFKTTIACKWLAAQ